MSSSLQQVSPSFGFVVQNDALASGAPFIKQDNLVVPYTRATTPQLLCKVGTGVGVIGLGAPAACVFLGKVKKNTQVVKNSNSEIVMLVTFFLTIALF